jgi:nitroimidazol reductase NimA-like FMN-containing flavoprotein (pyridoxamine 5'-phosphate oxidase superfamily)
MRITKMQDRECRDTLRRLGFGRLGCVRENQPYIVPVYFAYEPDHLYGFATFGQKIEYMRANPHVCVEADEVLGQDNWVSVVVLGRYEELPDTPEYGQERRKAQSLLEKRAMWWQVAYAESNIRGRSEASSPVFYCVHIEEMSGLRASSEGSPARVR